MVRKLETLSMVRDLGHPTARTVAGHLGAVYHDAAVGLLRCHRQGLVERWRGSSSEPYRYRLTVRGEQRLRYLEETEDEDDEYEVYS